MGPSSTLVIELSESDSLDPKNPKVKVFINDNLVETNQCNGKSSCDMNTFINALKTDSSYFKIIDINAEYCAKK
jgi:hypothetical protein